MLNGVAKKIYAQSCFTFLNNKIINILCHEQSKYNLDYNTYNSNNNLKSWKQNNILI